MTERPSALAVDRRGFIRLVSTTTAGWLALGAASDRMRIVASLTALPLDDELTRRSMIDSPTSRLGGLIAGLRQRGWVEGVNFRFERDFAADIAFGLAESAKGIGDVERELRGVPRWDRMDQRAR